MKEWYEGKTRGKLGPEKNDGKEIKILNRRVESADQKIIYEADQNIQTILKELGLDGKAKGLDVLMVMNHEAAPEQTTDLSREETGKFRRIPALMNYVAQGPAGHASGGQPPV